MSTALNRRAGPVTGEDYTRKITPRLPSCCCKIEREYYSQYYSFKEVTHAQILSCNGVGNFYTGLCGHAIWWIYEYACPNSHRNRDLHALWTPQLLRSLPPLHPRRPSCISQPGIQISQRLLLSPFQFISEKTRLLPLLLCLPLPYYPDQGLFLFGFLRTGFIGEAASRTRQRSPRRWKILKMYSVSSFLFGLNQRQKRITPPGPQAIPCRSAAMGLFPTHWLQTQQKAIIIIKIRLSGSNWWQRMIKARR